jgi:integrase
MKPQSDARGWSTFWRKDKKRWVLGYNSSTGWKQKCLPVEIPKVAKKDADTWAETWLAAKRGNAPSVGKLMQGAPPLRDRFDLWIAMREKLTQHDDEKERLSPATVVDNRQQFKQRILPKFGAESVPAVASDFSGLRTWFRDLCGEVSASRARNIYSTLRTFFDDGIVEKWFFGENPLRNAVMVRELPPLPREGQRQVVIIPLEHLQELVDSPKVAFERRVRYICQGTTGERDGEMFGATWGDVTIEGAIPLWTIRNARRIRRKKDEVLGKLKTGTSYRALPLHPAALAALREWRDHADGVTLILGRKPRPTDPIFPTTQGKFQRPKTAERLRADLRMLGLPDTVKGKNLTMHASRRTFATYLRKAGIDRESRKRLMGHSAADVLAEHYTEKEMAEFAAAVASISLTWAGFAERSRTAANDTPTPWNEQPQADVTVPSTVPPTVPAGTVLSAAAPQTLDIAPKSERRGWDSNPRMTVLQTVA